MPAYHDDWEIVYTIRDEDNLIVVFYFDVFNGNRYANVRKCIESPTFQGPTRKGMKFKEEIIKPILSGLEELRQTVLEDGIEITNIEKNFKTRIIISVVNDTGHFRIDIREYSVAGRYIGPTRKGVRLGYEHINELIEGFQSLEEGS